MTRGSDTVRAVCVYCGSCPGNDAAYVKAGEQMGRALATSGLALVYGGGTRGVMNSVMREALDNGGKVAAIIPKFLIGRETTAGALKMFDDLTITHSMHERKLKMFERSDAFVALPGGIGTAEEIMEIMSLCQLGQHQKPIVLVNVNGFWGPLVAMLDHMHNTGFIREFKRVRPVVVERVEDVIPTILAAATATEGNEAVIRKM